MSTAFPSTLHWSVDGLPPDVQQRIRNTAASLERSALAGHAVQTLRGKNLAVLCETVDCPGLERFRRAANALGAQVTQIRPSDALNVSARSSDAVGSLLGRLYDAIDCHGLEPAVIERLARVTGKPVFNDLARHGGTGSGPGAETSTDGFTLQALLLSALAT
jgi:ornithine carbamoyltransferase